MSHRHRRRRARVLSIFGRGLMVMPAVPPLGAHRMRRRLLRRRLQRRWRCGWRGEVRGRGGAVLGLLRPPVPAWSKRTRKRRTERLFTEERECRYVRRTHINNKQKVHTIREQGAGNSDLLFDRPPTRNILQGDNCAPPGFQYRYGNVAHENLKSSGSSAPNAFRQRPHPALPAYLLPRGVRGDVPCYHTPHCARHREEPD